MGRKKLPSTIKKEKALISKKVTTTKSAKSPLSELHTQFEDIQINLSKGYKNRVGELKKEIAQAAKYLKKEKKLAKQAVKGKGKKLVDKGVKGLSHLKSGLIDLKDEMVEVMAGKKKFSAQQKTLAQFERSWKKKLKSKLKGKKPGKQTTVKKRTKAQSENPVVHYIKEKYSTIVGSDSADKE
jgi:hypothetical protein